MAELQQLYGALGAEPREAMVSLRTLLTRYETPNELSWVLGLALLTAAVFAFGIGANDVANSFGTTASLPLSTRERNRRGQTQRSLTTS